jgi:hypothetical protein
VLELVGVGLSLLGSSTSTQASPPVRVRVRVGVRVRDLMLLNMIYRIRHKGDIEERVSGGGGLPSSRLGLGLG